MRSLHRPHKDTPSKCISQGSSSWLGMLAEDVWKLMCSPRTCQTSKHSKAHEHACKSSSIVAVHVCLGQVPHSCPGVWHRPASAPFIVHPSIIAARYAPSPSVSSSPQVLPLLVRANRKVQWYNSSNPRDASTPPPHSTTEFASCLKPQLSAVGLSGSIHSSRPEVQHRDAAHIGVVGVCGKAWAGEAVCVAKALRWVGLLLFFFLGTAFFQ